MQRVIRGTVVLAAAVLAAGSLQAQGGKKVAAPTGVTVTSNATTLTVSWTNVANAGSYKVNRREGTTVTALGTVAGTPWTGPLPPAGPYEFQVVSIGSGQRNTAASAWVAYTVPMATPTTTTGVIVTEPRPTTGGTITPYVPAGPAWLTAASSIPGEIALVWKEVAGAARYRIVRSSDAPEPESTVNEQAASGFWSEGGMFNWTNAPVDERWTFTYKVFALFPNSTGGYVASTASPAATARSAAVVQPTGLKYAVALTGVPGRVNVTLSWNAVPNAARYGIKNTAALVGQDPILVSGTSYVFPNILAGGTYQPPPCVWTIYAHAQDESTATCLDLQLR